MAWYDNVMNSFAQRVAGFVNDQLQAQYGTLGKYYAGNQRKFLKKKDGSAQDDNVILNFVALAVDRSVSRLYRSGVEFVLPEGAEAQQEYLDAVWDLNKKEIIMYQVGLHGSVYGTPYFKIVPDGIQNPYTEEMYPRLIPLDPEICRVKTDPQDMQKVIEYRIEYTVTETDDYGNVKKINYREITRQDRPTDYEAEPKETPGYWVVEYWEMVGESGRWVLVKSEQWPYTFPPILHWKNLPSLKSAYGDSDIDDVINVQDHENFVVSNTGKIIKYHAHPRTIITGASVKELEPSANIESLWGISNPDANVANLEVQSDLASSRNYAQDLRQSIFDISREVDITSITDRLGTLTNFGLRVLYSDATDKNDTKRQLYGDAFKELNRRLLVLQGFEGEQSHPGEIKWGQALIIDIAEEMQTDQLALDMGIVDKETIVDRYKDRYGLDWGMLQERLAEQAAADNQNNSDIGSLILRNFSQGV